MKIQEIIYKMRMGYSMVHDVRKNVCYLESNDDRVIINNNLCFELKHRDPQLKLFSKENFVLKYTFIEPKTELYINENISDQELRRILFDFKLQLNSGSHDPRKIWDFVQANPVIYKRMISFMESTGWKNSHEFQLADFVSAMADNNYDIA